ncbi:hypothetical protein QM012_003388 [Aureobasidium pullulans]|uniref:Amidase domain-containing protein n=1 Tax=Aureobasidium pullulans TaxID=5580 RepID=A0ABR0T894_AURPU
MTKLLNITRNSSEPPSIERSGQQLYFELDGVSYVAVHNEGDIGHPSNGISLVTIFIIPPFQVVDSVWMETQIQTMIKHDDVFKVQFLAGIVLVSQSEMSDPCIAELQDFLKSRGYTSDTISPLMGAGANVIGFTKLSSLISREEPSEAVDFQNAFISRGDGYQSPTGSSSESEVSVAAYDWVDFAIGRDASGSGRRPALVNGVYQFRPSYDLVPRQGMIQTFSPWDTPCVFTRDVKKLPNFVNAWYSLRRQQNENKA